jgi:transposase
MTKLPPDLSTVTTVGLDITKHVFQVHAVDAAGRVVLNRALRGPGAMWE